jgi:hypothetical protein
LILSTCLLSGFRTDFLEGLDCSIESRVVDFDVKNEPKPARTLVEAKDTSGTELFDPP